MQLNTHLRSPSFDIFCAHSLSSNRTFSFSAPFRNHKLQQAEKAFEVEDDEELSFLTCSADYSFEEADCCCDTYGNCMCRKDGCRPPIFTKKLNTRMLSPIMVESLSP